MALAASLGPGRDVLMPRSPGGNGAGAVLSLLVHAALLLALTTAVEWRSRSTDVVTAELWAAVPQVAGAPAPQPPAPAPAPAPTPTPPPPPAPPVRAAEPPPPEPDIALERAERRKAELQKEEQAKQERLKAQAKAEAERERIAAEQRQAQQAEAERKQAEAERKRREAREAKAEAARLAKVREQTLARMMGQASEAAGNTGSGSAARDAGPSAAYAARLAALIRRNSRFAGTLADNDPTEVEVVTAPGGTILSRRIVKSSGHPEWDAAVVRAIDRTARLPPDERGVVPSPMTIEFRPNER
jgi:colicin import membrane protein